jgi:hypothetical protein
MNELSTRIRTALWWFVPLVLCAALLAWETDFGHALRTLPPAPEPIEARPVVTSLLPEFAIAGGTAARADTVQRTLFNPTRRPAPVAAVEAAKARMQRGQFALTGTTVVDGKSTAFLRETAGGKSRHVKQGETINGLMVAEVKSDRIRLMLGDESEEIYLRVATNPRPTAQPAPAAPVTAAGAAQPAAPAAEGTAAAAGLPADASLAERRRAARATQAAQAATQGQAPAAPDGNPIPAPARAVAPTSAPAAATPAVAAPAPDPRWGEMYKNYQQNRSPTPKQ